MSHYEERLEQDLTIIDTELDALGARVSQALRDSMRALLTGDREIAHRTVLGDHPINRASLQLDWHCHTFIARHLPSAAHLRRISSVIRINVSLERIGDYAVTICREGLQLDEPPGRKVSTQLQSLANQVEKLLDDVIDAFVEGNVDKARALRSIPEQVERSMDGVYAGLTSSKKRSTREIVAIFVVFSLLKRVADQAKNICDQTVFAVAGEIKTAKIFRVLFIDETNSYRSQMAAAIARKRFPNVGEYSSAGRDPAQSVDPALVEFLEEHGIDSHEVATRSISSVNPDLNTFDLIVSLDDDVRSFIPSVPFHATALQWRVPRLSEDLTTEQKTEEFGNSYRMLTERIDQLMQTLVGDDAT